MKMYIIQSVIGLALLVGCIESAHAKTNLNMLKGSMSDIESVIRKSYASYVKQTSVDDATGCQCVGYDCGCCLYIHIPEVKMDDTGCLNLTYLPDQYGISVTFSFDNKVLLNMTVSAKNPPPICFGIPYLEKEASLCLDLYNLDYSNTSFSGCARLEARLVFVVIEKLELGCWRIPLHGILEAKKAAKLIEQLKAARKDISV